LSKGPSAAFALSRGHRWPPDSGGEPAAASRRAVVPRIPAHRGCRRCPTSLEPGSRAAPRVSRHGRPRLRGCAHRPRRSGVRVGVPPSPARPKSGARRRPDPVPCCSPCAALARRRSPATRTARHRGGPGARVIRRGRRRTAHASRAGVSESEGLTMISRRTFLERASWGLLTLGDAEIAVPQSTNLHVFYDPAILRHEPSSEHPESRRRLAAVMTSARARERQGKLAVMSPRPATDDDVLLVHTPDYLKIVRAEIAEGRRQLSTGDTELSPGTLTAA